MMKHILFVNMVEEDKRTFIDILTKWMIVIHNG